MSFASGTQGQPVAGSITASEVFEAIKTAKITYVTSTTVDISFPYRFSDGNTWASITGFSINGTTAQGFTGLTVGNVYWLGIYIDLTAAYSSTTAPTSSNVDLRLSNANTTEPTKANNYSKIATYIPFTASGAAAGTMLDFNWTQLKTMSHFVSAGNGSLSSKSISLTSTGSTLASTAVGISVASIVPPNAREYNVLLQAVTVSGISKDFTVARNTAASVTSQLYTGQVTSLAGAPFIRQILHICETIPQEFRYAYASGTASIVISTYTEE